jgi:hypothetical protein
MELQSLQSKGEPTVEPAGLVHSNPSCFRNIAFNAFDALDASWNLGRSAGICPGRFSLMNATPVAQARLQQQKGVFRARTC